MTADIHVMSRLDAECWTDAPANGACISITNPRQAPAAVAQWNEERILRLGFHDCEKAWGNNLPMSGEQAKELLLFAHEHRGTELLVHCEFGASRSVAVGLFLSAWLKRPLSLPDDSLTPNKQVIRQLRRAALPLSISWLELRLAKLALRGLKPYLDNTQITYRTLLQDFL